ncbi:MAG: aminotransferase class I/II-fold pyridoxal phosphate-dependent enzyme [Anaerolineae bacterium]
MSSSRLNAIPGIKCRKPQGAFYAFPNVSGLGRTSKWLADYLLEEAGVAALPGTDFGEGGEGYLVFLLCQFDGEFGVGVGTDGGRARQIARLI